MRLLAIIAALLWLCLPTPELPIILLGAGLGLFPGCSPCCSGPTCPNCNSGTAHQQYQFTISGETDYDNDPDCDDCTELNTTWTLTYDQFQPINCTWSSVGAFEICSDSTFVAPFSDLYFFYFGSNTWGVATTNNGLSSAKTWTKTFGSTPYDCEFNESGFVSNAPLFGCKTVSSGDLISV